MSKLIVIASPVLSQHYIAPQFQSGTDVVVTDNEVQGPRIGLRKIANNMADILSRIEKFAATAIHVAPRRASCLEQGHSLSPALRITGS